MSDARHVFDPYVPPPRGFEAVSRSIIAGGTVTDDDVNEWVEAAKPRRGVWRRVLDWLLEVFDDRR